jgi:all-trans-retinol 13,14-reductase
MPSYKQQTLDDEWDAIVIGSGIGGLAAAALLSRHAGKKVLVLERHYTAGGYTHSFNRPGYSWDVGVHYIGEVQDPRSPVRAVFDHLTEGQLRWQPMPDIYDRVVIGTGIGARTFGFPTGLENLRTQLKQSFPGEAAAIDHYLAAVQSAQKSSGLYFAEKAVPRPIALLAGRFMRAPFLKWAGQTTLDVLHRWTRNPELIGILTAQWGDYGLPPSQSSFGIHALIASHYFNGASYPLGGATRIAETITPSIERNGGKVVVSADVAEIVIRNGQATGVKMADGREFRSAIVISDAGARNTFERLIRQPQSSITEELRLIPGSIAHLSLYAGVKQSAAELGLNGANLWIFPTPDHDANMARFLNDLSAPFPALFISFPSAKDPLFERKHPGRATVEAVAFAPYAPFAQFENTTTWKRRGQDYEALKNGLAQRLRHELELAVPSIAGKIDHAELSTPLTTRHFMNYQQGEAYGLAATPQRFRARSLTPHTSVRNLYLAGQDVASMGVTGAMMGGVIAASAILRRNLVSIVTKPAVR